jgi:hypothetical protein
MECNISSGVGLLTRSPWTRVDYAEWMRVGKFRFFFFSNEGAEPPHIHVEAGDCYAKFSLQPVSLLVSFGFNSKELRALRMMVEGYAGSFAEKWNEHFKST